MKLRILTYNMHKGFCFYSRQYVLSQLREAIREVDADIVFLQEVTGMHPEDFNEGELSSQFEYLADEIWHHFAYGKNAVYSSGHHGNAILSKIPFTRYENINVSTNRLEKRGLLHAVIQFQGIETHLVCLHLNLFERSRRAQMQSLIRRVQNSVPWECPLIVAGDFNDWKENFTDPLESELDLLESGVVKHGEHPKTFPCWRPLFSLDRVYVRKFKVLHHDVLFQDRWRQMSDHAAIVVDLEMHPF